MIRGISRIGLTLMRSGGKYFAGRSLIIIPVVACLVTAEVFAQDIPEGGEAVLAEDAIFKMTLQGTSYARKKTVDVEGMPFDSAVEIETYNQPDNSWGTQLALNTSAAIDKDDVLLAVFYAKGIESSEETGEVLSEFIFEKSSDPWTKSKSYPIIVIGEWRLYLVPFICVEAYDAGEGSVKFRLGYPPQIIQLGGLEVLNYKKTLTIDDLPRTKTVYAGMEPDAPWRAEAEQRIDTYRKGDIEVIVRDIDGNPVSGAKIHVKMQKHAYKFGSAVSSQRMMGSGPDIDMYNEIIEKYFNRVVFENDLKWGPWENLGRRETTFEATDWLLDSGIDIRGHCLVWPGWNYLPDDLEANQNDPEYLRKRIMDHVEEEAGEMAGKLADWDVVNEPYWNHDIQDILGEDVLLDWYDKVHEMDPAVNLYLNDNNIISGGGLDNVHQEHFYRTVEYLKGNGAPIHGLGTQCHFGENVTPPVKIWQILDKLASYGLEIQATEFDISTDDEDLQVNYTRDFMTAYFAHPSTVGILTWGFWAGQHWRPQAALWDEEWNIRPHGEVWVKLVSNDWWTDANLIADAAGQASIRGFLGEYDLDIEYDGKEISSDFGLSRGGVTVTTCGDSIHIEHGEVAEVKVGRTEQPSEFGLAQNYPNPFNPTTTIEYQMPRNGFVELKIVDTLGREVRTLIRAEQNAGRHRVVWNGMDDNNTYLPSGVYFYKMRSEGRTATRKLLLLK